MGKSMSGILIIPFFCFFFIATTSLGFCYGSFNISGCSPSEREALLKFKHELKDPSKRLTTWVGDGDCCSWSGVICDNLTGHVLELHLRSLSFQEYYDLGGYYYGEYLKKSTFGGKISPSLLNLKELRFLDLSNNDFGGIQIPKFLGSIGSLRYLNLSGAGFGGMIPHELANLSNLQYLNLNGRSGNYYGTLYVDSFHWLSSLSLLEFLDLSYVDLSQSFNWLEVMNTLPFLEEVHLSDCDLVRIPSLVNVNFSSLSILDLSLNFFSLVPKWIFLLKSLKSLNLARNFFYGPIPKDFRNMTSLQELDLSVNDFNSSVPDCLFNLPHLELLSLVSNALQGKIPSTIGNMTSLASLDLSLNSDLQLEGGIPTSFKNLCNLKSLSLESLNLSQDINAGFE